MIFDTKYEYEKFLKMQSIANLTYKHITIYENDYKNFAKIKYTCDPTCKIVDMLFLKPLTIPTNYNHSLFITDKTGKEISDDTKIKIKYCKDKIQTYDIAKLYYYDVKRTNKNGGFNFHNNIKVNLDYHFVIEIVESKIDISKENIKFTINIDYWTDFYHP